jgi:hypothetical protein
MQNKEHLFTKFTENNIFTSHIDKKNYPMQFFLLQRKTLVTISTRTTDRSHFLIFANTYEAAL